MSLGRLFMALGFLFVTFVMIRSYAVSDMLFQFGGLALGAGVFYLGWTLEQRRQA